MKELFLGIDGGGTKTAVCLIDKDMKIISTAFSGPSSYDTVCIEVLKNNISEAISKLKYDGKIVSCFAGLGGIAKQEDAEVVCGSLKEIDQLKDALIEVDNDVVNAYYSAIGDGVGIVCIIGTGSVAYGINNGKSHRAGGYCYQEGDTGSSYDLGHKALKYYAMVIDKRVEKTDFSDAIGEYINVYNFSDLVSYFINASRTEIASIARVVTKYSHNEWAKKIISDAVDGMILMIKACYNELHFDDCVFSIIGSLGNSDTLYKELLMSRLKVALPKLKYAKPKYEAYLGSSLKALTNYERKF